MIELKQIKETDLPIIHDIGYTEEMPFWATMNAPYFNEYKQVDLEEFLKTEAAYYLKDEGVAGIYLNDVIIGMVSCYWESKATRWLEMGIVIYQESKLRKGYGREAMRLWIQKCFSNYPEIERVGMTTWSGNTGLIALAQRLGMQEEARIRKVRYYEGVYYDSMKYGILRSEWNTD